VDPSSRRRSGRSTRPGGYSGWRAIAAPSRRYGNLSSAASSATTTSTARPRAQPLVRTDHAFTAGFGMSWIFAASSQRVVAED
jgi:hypothetical protein